MENKILACLLKEKFNFWKMVSAMDYMPDFVSVLKKMQKENLIEIKNSYLSITEKGKEKASALRITPEELISRNIYNIQVCESLLSDYTDFRNIVFEKEEFDQLQITPEDILKKIEAMKIFNDLKGKRIVCLGDDDLVGIALALTKEAKQITVLDIDKDIIEYENSVFNKLRVNGAAYICDFLKPLPDKFKGQYDVFITEPPDTIEGINLYFSRGIECLDKKGGIAYLGISKTDLENSDFLTIERNILRMNGLITDVFSHFEGYNPSKIDFKWVLGLPQGVDSVADEPWFFSDLFRIKIMEGAVPLIKGEKGEKFRQQFIITEINLDYPLN